MTELVAVRHRLTVNCKAGSGPKAQFACCELKVGNHFMRLSRARHKDPQSPGSYIVYTELLLFRFRYNELPDI
jgi:hypothetical protein